MASARKDLDFPYTEIKDSKDESQKLSLRAILDTQGPNLVITSFLADSEFNKKEKIRREFEFKKAEVKLEGALVNLAEGDDPYPVIVLQVAESNAEFIAARSARKNAEEECKKKLTDDFQALKLVSKDFYGKPITFPDPYRNMKTLPCEWIQQYTVNNCSAVDKCFETAEKIERKTSCGGLLCFPVTVVGCVLSCALLVPLTLVRGGVGCAGLVVGAKRDYDKYQRQRFFNPHNKVDLVSYSEQKTLPAPRHQSMD